MDLQCSAGRSSVLHFSNREIVFFFHFLLLMVLVVGDLRMAMKSKAATEV